MAKMYVAKESFWTTIDGVPTMIQAGRSLVEENSDLHKRFPQNFREAEAQYRSDTEQATKAPGEQRAVKIT